MPTGLTAWISTGSALDCTEDSCRAVCEAGRATRVCVCVCVCDGTRECVCACSDRVRSKPDLPRAYASYFPVLGLYLIC